MSMAPQPERGRGSVHRYRDLVFRYDADCLVSRPVGPDTGARGVVLEVVRIPPGRRHDAAGSESEENNVVVFAGSGETRVASRIEKLTRGGALHARTGKRLVVDATGDEELVLYVWRTRLPEGRPLGMNTKRVGSLWDDETQLVGFTGYGGVDPDWRLATMNVVFWPGSGSAYLCLHCGLLRPGEAFAVHLHPRSEEAVVVFEGTGQMYLHDRWIDVEPGDILFAPPGIRHGTRKPRGGSAQRFVTCGGPTPFDPAVYQRAGVSPDVR
jgi:mannose-6-phosphate isomerase-like protein (cupin superfamily)